MEIKKVLYISQEIAPFVAESPMSVLGRDLAQGIVERGPEVRAFMPKYGVINERRNQLHPVIRLSGMNIIIDDTDHPLIIKVATMQPSRMQVYCIYNEDYFAHSLTKELEIDSSPADNDERCMFYVRGVIETVRKLRWEPSIIHCSGWVTALAPVYMRNHYADDPSFRDAKIVYSLFDNDFTQPFDARFADKLRQDGISADDYEPLLDKQATQLDLTRLALRHCDAVTQCSPEINPEILKLVEESGLPFLPYQDNPDTLVDTYWQFYQSLG